MNLLDDISLFHAVIKNGGFSHAAKHLGLSNGLVSRRIAQLEKKLNVALIKRTTRQLQLTPEGNLLWQHAQNIHQELESAMNTIHSSANAPEGVIRLCAPTYFGRYYLMPVLLKFLNQFGGIKIELYLSNQSHEPIKDHFDFVIQGAGFSNKEFLEDSGLKMKLLFKDSIGVYASKSYLKKYGKPISPNDLTKHIMVSFKNERTLREEEKWKYSYKNKEGEVKLIPRFKYNDIDCGIAACLSGVGIGKFTGLVIKNELKKNQLVPLLQNYHWGRHNYYAVYSSQQSLPARTRLLLDYIEEEIKSLK